MNHRKKAMLLLVALLGFHLGICAQSLSLKMQNVSVKNAMTELQTKSGYSFVYIAGDVNTEQNVSVDADSLKEAIEQILQGQQVTYEIQGKNIVIRKVERQQQATQQKRQISGTVKDVYGESVIGANVTVKGQLSVGTITDIDGQFVLEVPADAVLQVSFIGFTPQEVQVGNQHELDITLKEDTKMLDEVVVVGFGTQKKVNLTGAVSTVDAETFEARPVSTAVQALQGVIPGLQISSSTGALDKDQSINIRGIGTIGDGSSGSPLILIDGMEGDINTISPQDIENISVLKDAAASSIYGSRAPFGVILITTKSGSEGKTSVNYNNSFRIASPINLPKNMDSYSWANFLNSGSLNNGAGQLYSDEVMQQMLDCQNGKIEPGVPMSSNGQWGKPDYDPFLYAYANTEWYSEIYKDNVFSQEHNVSVNGGSAKMKYYASFNYLNQNGLLRHGHDGTKRYSATAKLNLTLTDWLKLNLSTRFIRKDNERPTAYNDNMYDVIWPNLLVYDPNGYYYDNGGNNPAMSLAEGGSRNAVADRHYYQASLVIEPIKGWVTNVDYNYSIWNNHIKEFSLPVYNHDVNGNVVDTKGTSYLYDEHLKEDYWNLNVYSTYEKMFNEAHSLKVMIGTQIEEKKQSFSYVSKNGLMVDDMPEFDLTTGTDGNGNELTPSIVGNSKEWATAGFFGRVNYVYRDRYLAEFNLRYDGTSRFRRGNRWQTSPSVSLGWNIANENFWQPISNTVNALKLRFSYGELGNQNTTEWYPTYRMMTLGAYDGGWIEGLKKPNTAIVGDLVSTLLTWETVRTWNVGLDFGLFNNRLTGSFDYYTRFTDNMVGPAPELPSILGVNVPKTNNCDLKTIGWELALNWRDRLSNGLGYGIGLSLSDARTFVESYPGNGSNSIDTYIAGREIGEIWGFETVGIAKTDIEMQTHLDKVGGQDALGFNWAAGDIMYKDLDGKPGITEGGRTLDDHGDLKVIGNNTPRYFFGIDLTADWKGFDVRCFFQGILKRDYWCTEKNFWGIYTDMWGAIGLEEHTDYFRAEPIGLPERVIPANLDAYYPRPIINNGTKNHYVQTRYLQDASYIRLKNLQVGYSLPHQWIRKVGLSRCRVYVSGENLWTGTSLTSLYDPEIINGGFTKKNTYPLSRTWSLGLDITF